MKNEKMYAYTSDVNGKKVVVKGVVYATSLKDAEYIAITETRLSCNNLNDAITISFI